jgi:hypothetical protein
MADGIEALGVNIVGDIASLGKLPADGPDPADGEPGPAADDGAAPLMVPVEAAVSATLGAFIAGGAGGQTTEEIVRDLDTTSLARVLANRCRRRVRRALPG